VSFITTQPKVDAHFVILQKVEDWVDRVPCATFSKLSWDTFQRSSYIRWFENSKGFSFPNSGQLSLRFQSSFLMSVN